MISDTDIEAGHRLLTLWNEINVQMPIHLLDLEVDPYLHSHLLSISSALKSTKIRVPVFKTGRAGPGLTS